MVATNGNCTKNTSLAILNNLIDNWDEIEIDNVDLNELYELSIDKSELFWGTLARKRLEWYQEFSEVCNSKSFNCENFDLKWFTGGKLNVSGWILFYSKSFFNLNITLFK